MATPSPWVVMVYMQAGDTSQLDNLAIQDLLEMEAGVRENPDVLVFVQIQRRWPAVPQWYLLKAGALPEVIAAPPPASEDDDLLNMGSSKALETFLSAGLKYKAEKYCLVLWGHAFGLGFGRDHGDALRLQELQTALEKFRKGRAGEARLDILATNSCTMGYVEAAFQLGGDVQYMVASQVFVPLTGLPYKEILSGIHGQLKADDLGRMMVDRYVDHFSNSPQGERVSMALLNLDRAQAFGEMLSGVAETITRVIGPAPHIDFERLCEVQDVFFVNPAGDVRPVLDLHALASDLITFSKDHLHAEAATDRHAPGLKKVQTEPNHFEKLQTQLNELTKAIDGSAPNSKPQLAMATGRVQSAGGLVEYRNSHPDLNDLRGVGVFAPFVVDKEVRKRLEITGPKDGDSDDRKGRRAYESLKIFSGGRGLWPKLVYERLSREEPDEIVDGTGVVRPADRRHVNQLLVAIEAAFNRLDRVTRSAEGPLAAAVVRNKRDAAATARILRSFGPPKLKLAGGLSLMAHKELEKLESGTAGGSVTETDIPIVSTLATIEKSVRLVEQTCKRVLTNRTFGLGPPSSKAPALLHLGDPKEAGEVLGDPKEAGEVLGDPKEAGEVLGDPKEAGEVLGPLGSEKGAVLALLSSDAQAAGLAVSALFTQVALAMLRLERATAAIESAAAKFLFKAGYGDMLSPEDYEQTVQDRFERAFGVLKEVSLQARRTIRGILAHPLYGLGPGPEGLGQEERDGLAAAAGLNLRNLRLL